MSAFLNMGSLSLGLLAWIIPSLLIIRPGKFGVKKSCSFIIASFAACSAALCLQFFEVNNRVNLEDWSAIMDTIGTLKWVAVVLAVVTVVLNVLALKKRI